MVQVSNADRVIFPGAELTKGDVVAHYERVGEHLLDFAAGRPLTIQRFPKGIAAKGFMQKNAAKHFPDSIRRHSVPKRDGEMTDYPVVDRAEDFAYLANQGTVTFHMWTASVARPDEPDWMIIDLDPEADDLSGVRQAAAAIRDLLRVFGLEGSLVATGSKGFHIWVPLQPGQTFGQVGLAARALSGIAARRHPEQLTTEFLKKNRSGRVFLDWLRNGPIATVVVPFSLRPRATAPVAVPLGWGELATTEPDSYTLDGLRDPATLAERVAAFGTLDGYQLPVDEIVAEATRAGVDLDTPHDRFGRNPA